MPFDLTTPSGLEAYLNSHGVTYSHVSALTGGTGNFVYRVVLTSKSNTNPSTVIYKHAAPFLASNHAFEFSPARMDYESLALQRIPHLLSTSTQLEESTVKPATWYSYDREAKLLQISDGGERNLKVAYNDPALDIPALGSEIGKWVATLHLSANVSLNPDDESDPMSNNPIAVGIYRYSYQNLHIALKEYGQDPKFGEWINEEYGSKLAIENDCICHGDFWPGNVLVGPSSSASTSRDSLPELTVVDWELVRRGTSATDVAQFAAESFLLDRFRGDRGLRNAFSKAYAQTLEEGATHGRKRKWSLGRDWVKRMAVHWGVHVAFWPTRVEWGSKEQTNELVKAGVAVMKAAVEERWEDLEKSYLFEGTGILGYLLSETVDKI